MSIRLKLTVMFLAASLIPALFVGTLTYNNYKNSLISERLSYLHSVASLKADKIETYFNSLKKDMGIIQNSYAVRKSLPVLSRLASDPADPEFVAAKNMLDETLTKVPSILGFPDIMLVNPAGRVVYSINPEHYKREFLQRVSGETEKAFTEGRGKVYFSDIYSVKEQGDKPQMLVSGPAADLNGAYAGVVVFEVDMTPVYKIIQDLTGLGQTGETLVGKRIGNEAVFLNPLRHDPQAALRRRVPMGDLSALAIQKAVLEEKGSGELTDYRGKKVIADWRYLPEPGWGMAVKIDTQEVLADVQKLRNVLIVLLALISVLSVISAFLIGRKIAKPIVLLSKGAEIIGSGELGHRIKVNSEGELNALAVSFNRMAQDLQASIASRDAERQRLYSVLEALPVMVCLLTEDHQVAFANRSFRKKFGEAKGRPCYEYCFGRSQPCEFCESYRVLETGKPHKWEVNAPDGRVIEAYDFPFTDTDGSRMILEMDIDVTEQRRSQDIIKQANAYNRNLIEASLDPLVTISGEGKITDVNEATIKVTGVAREKLIGTDFSGYFTEPEKASLGYKQVFARGTVTDYPLTIRSRDGKLTDVLYSASVYKDETGKVLGVFAAARDVTLQKQASQYARSLIEASLDPLVTISADGKITDVNEATIKSTGLTRAELIGTDFSRYFTEPEKAKFGYQQVFARGFVMDYPLTLRHKDGQLTDVLYNATVYKDSRGEVLGVFAAARDVTDRKRAEEELKRHRDHLEAMVEERTAEVKSKNLELARSNENLEQFAYVASHDLQEPLRIMASYSQLLEQRYKTKLDMDAGDFIDYIVDAARRMQRLINDLLNYSRVGRLDNALEEYVDCNLLLGRVIASLRPVIEESGAAITNDSLPVLLYNETNFTQLFQNLIQNAIKFRGSESPYIHVSAKFEGNEWVFSVRDNGIGIEGKYKERIFQIFQRLHARDKYPGTGIGLSICKKIVEAYGGRVWVDSEAGKGSTFYFTVPVKKGKEKEK